ncbi:hypothetical protein BLA29_000617 [Euroglyphus maynei]|uniref:Uncharacterized protein n=1 Tax=Euroglyphus maynei TaxID=6958 RepID=A0A1Y3B792_EURMA|nr:hypothetical protein BLA29_000617 [Euroglyphus maynei]
MDFFHQIFNSDQNFRNVYTILCEFVDESVVERVSISGWGSMDEVHRFPKPGKLDSFVFRFSHAQPMLNPH